MIRSLDAAYRAFARDVDLYIVVLKSADPKAFCAGGDMRMLCATARSNLSDAMAILRAEYSFNWLAECFSKPSVAWIDGIVMGSGVGLSAYCTHRVAGPRYRFAMPETAIGFFPDVGMAHVLARLPHRIGYYLALTGSSIGRADAFALGLLTHCLEPVEFAEVEAALAGAEPVDPLLDARHTDPGGGPVWGEREAIEKCFADGSLEQMMARLDAVTGLSREFAATTLATLRTRAPFALKATLRHLNEAAAADLRQTLETDYRLACRFLAGTDLYEGVRAALVDKDNAPRWSPATLGDVTPDLVNDAFAPLAPGRALNLPLRQDMQSMRV